MIVHICSHFGDIEVSEVSEGKARIRYFRLTSEERAALSAVLGDYGLEPPGEEGEIVLDASTWDVGAGLAARLHAKRPKVATAVRFRGGRVSVARGGLLEWIRRARGEPQPEGASPPPAATGRPEAAVQIPLPQRGCPMPNVTELKEQRAAEVVRKFLLPAQVRDFDRHRAFLAIGCDTGRAYRVTSRWSPAVSQYGVLCRSGDWVPMCASSPGLPPSEEALAAKLAVEHFEAEFLAAHEAR